MCFDDREIAHPWASVLVILFLSYASILGKPLAGKVAECESEGSEVKVPLVSKDPCYKCFCKHGQVECLKPDCPNMDGCHAVLFSRPAGHCCDVCKGCTLDSTVMPHGASWPDDLEPCIIRACHAGVLTSTTKQCRPPCSHPITVPGQCCPVCQGCRLNGKNYMSGETFTMNSAPDVECICMMGNVTCSSRACPVLNCPEWARYKLPGQQCHTCKGQRKIFDLPGSCYLAQRVYNHGDQLRADNCTTCNCKHGTMICEREQCRQLTCAPTEQIHVSGVCCPVCPNQQSCEAAGRKVKHGEVWQKDLCTPCTCNDGRWLCHTKKCPIKDCPRGFVLASTKNKCCPACVKEYSTCTMKGNTYNKLRTFDCFRYRTQGYCLHELAKDCEENNFSVRVKFEERSPASNRSSNVKKNNRVANWITIRFGIDKVRVFRGGKIRVNKEEHVSHMRQTMTDLNGISKHNDVDTEDIKVSSRKAKVSVFLNVPGITLSWDMARNVIRLKVNTVRYGGGERLCGLCGQINQVSVTRDYASHKKRFTKNRRFEAIPPRDMAKAWRYGRSCRVRNKTASANLALKKPAPKTYNAFESENISQLFHSFSTATSHNDTAVESTISSRIHSKNVTASRNNNIFQVDTVGSKRHKVNHNSSDAKTLNTTNNTSEMIKPINTFTGQNNTHEKSLVEISNPSCKSSTQHFSEAVSTCQSVRDIILLYCEGTFLIDTLMRSCVRDVCSCDGYKSCIEEKVNSYIMPCNIPQHISSTKVISSSQVGSTG